MKFHSMLHKGFVVASFAAALAILPATSKAQEITNAEFNDGPNVTALAQASVVQQQDAAFAPSAVPEQTIPVAEFAMPTTQVVPASTAIAVESEQADLIQVPAPSPNFWVSLLLLGCVALIVGYALAGAERDSQSRPVSTHNA